MRSEYTANLELYQGVRYDHVNIRRDRTIRKQKRCIDFLQCVSGILGLILFTTIMGILF